MKLIKIYQRKEKKKHLCMDRELNRYNSIKLIYQPYYIWSIIKAIVYFLWIGTDFHQSFKKCSIFTPDIRKQPHISLESV